MPHISIMALRQIAYPRLEVHPVASHEQLSRISLPDPMYQFSPQPRSNVSTK
jgi:hypothetical protein